METGLFIATVKHIAFVASLMSSSVHSRPAPSFMVLAAGVPKIHSMIFN